MNGNTQKLIAIVGRERNDPSLIACDLFARKTNGALTRMLPCQYFNPRGDDAHGNTKSQALPIAFRQAIGRASATLFALLGPENAELVREGLKCSARSIVMFSPEQLRDHDTCFDLARRATHAIYDLAQLQSLTSQSDPCLGLRTLKVKGVPQGTVLCRDAVWAFDKDHWIKYRVEGLTATACSQPAGEVFAGALIGALQDGFETVEAIRKAAGATTAFLHRKRSHRPRILSAAAAVVGVGIGLIIAFWAGTT